MKNKRMVGNISRLKRVPAFIAKNLLNKTRRRKIRRRRRMEGLPNKMRPLLLRQSPKKSPCLLMLIRHH